MKTATRRMLVILALLLLPGSGCSEPMGSAGSAETADDMQTAEPPGEVTVELELIDTEAGELRAFASSVPIRLRITLRNPTGHEVELGFSSGRTHDAVVLSSDGSELWRWSTGRMFSQALSELQLAAGSETSFELVCDPSAQGEAPLPAGRYRATGLIPTFGDELRSLAVEFEIEAGEEAE